MIPIADAQSHYEWQSPHLILHFDLNKTMTASDKAGNKSAHDVICAGLAEEVVDIWDDSLAEPIDYLEYVKHHLIPNPFFKHEIRAKQNEKVRDFLVFLKASGHSFYPKAQEIYDRAMQEVRGETQIFKSVYKMIDTLHDRKIPFTLVIRTFGSDGPEVVRELNDRYGIGFISAFHSVNKGDRAGLYAIVSGAEGHLAIRDDFEWWFKNGEDWRYGKPFPVEESDSRFLSLFFDDNAPHRPHRPNKNIVSPYDAISGEPIHPAALIDQKRIFPVTMLDALLDEDYYVRLIDLALQDS